MLYSINLTLLKDFIKTICSVINILNMQTILTYYTFIK